MRKFLFLTTFLGMAPFVFLLATFVLFVYMYRQYTLSASSYLSPTRTAAYAALPSIGSTYDSEIGSTDARSEMVRQFFEKYDSPLEPYANVVVNKADEYGLDFRLIPAIAMQESNLCKRMPAGSHNCWGFGIYGSTITRFADYPSAIEAVTKTLATKYKENGLDTPERIMTRYTPSSNGSWAHGVNYFLDQLQ